MLKLVNSDGEDFFIEVGAVVAIVPHKENISSLIVPGATIRMNGSPVEVMAQIEDAGTAKSKKTVEKEIGAASSATAGGQASSAASDAKK